MQFLKKPTFIQQDLLYFKTFWMQTYYCSVCPLETVLMYQTMLPKFAQLKEPPAIVSPGAVEDIYGFPKSDHRFLKEPTFISLWYMCFSTVHTAHEAYWWVVVKR